MQMSGKGRHTPDLETYQPAVRMRLTSGWLAACLASGSGGSLRGLQLSNRISSLLDQTAANLKGPKGVVEVVVVVVGRTCV